MIKLMSFSKTHAIILGEKDLLNKITAPIKCVYIIDGCYIGSTNDLKRRVREYIGRALRNEPVRSETPVMKYIKQRISEGQQIKFYILHTEPCREFIYINRYKKRGVKLLNVILNWTYEHANTFGKTGFYERVKETKRRTN